MSGSDLETSIALWGKTAAELLQHDQSDETKAAVEYDTDMIHKILRKKLSDEEEKLQQVIATEEEAIRTLKDRIHESQTETYHTSDTFLFDAKTLYQRIKQKEWCEVYNILTEKTKDSETIICATLIKILKECYNQCDQKIQSICEEIKHDIANPGTDQTQTTKDGKQKKQKQKTKEPDVDAISGITEDFLKKAGPGIFPYHKQSLIQHVKVKVSEECKSIQLKDERAEKAIEVYITKCLEFCWIQILENKEVKTEDNFKNLTKLLPKKYKQIQASRVIVTWPALVDRGGILEDAVLGKKADMEGERLNRKQKEAKPSGKPNSGEIEEITKQAKSHDIDKPVNNVQPEADIANESKSQSTGEAKMEQVESMKNKKPAPAAKPERQQSHPKLTGRDANGAKPERQQERSLQSKKGVTTVQPDAPKLTGRSAPKAKQQIGPRVETFGNNSIATDEDQISKAKQNTNF